MSSSYSAVDQWTGEEAEEAEEEQEENGDVVGDGTTFEDALKRGLDLVTGPSFSSSNLDTATPPGKNGPLLLPGGDSSSTRRRRRSSLSWPRFLPQREEFDQEGKEQQNKRESRKQKPIVMMQEAARDE